MTTTAWADLPNAQHIDRLLADLKARPAARDATWAATRDAVWAATRDAARAAARDAARDATWDAVWNAVWDATRDAARDATRDAARDAVWALIAWDDCSYILDMTPDAVRMLTHTTDGTTKHQAVLLLPAVIALTT